MQNLLSGEGELFSNIERKAGGKGKKEVLVLGVGFEEQKIILN